MKFYFQCAAHRPVPICGIPASGVDPKKPADAGQILADMSENRVGGEAYDREWPSARAVAVVTVLAGDENRY